MYKNKFIKNKLENYLCNLLKKKKFNNPSKRKILVECAEDPFYLIIFGLIINKNYNKKNIKIYQSRNFNVGEADHLFSSTLKRLLRPLVTYKYRELYKIFCHEEVGFNRGDLVNPKLLLASFKKALKIWKKLDTTQDLIDLKIDNILLGDLIYDTYLRFRPAPTIDLKSKYLLFLIFKAIIVYRESINCFEKNTFDVVMMSYSTYITNGILARVALEKNIEVFTFGNLQEVSKKLSKEDPYQTKYSSNYKQEFSQLSNGVKLNELSKKIINEKFSGKIISSISYMKESSYHESLVETVDLSGFIVIYLHDFYDSPHIYRWMIFPDFYIWLTYTIEYFLKNKIKFCIKPHPNALPDNKEIIERIKISYPTVHFLDPKISNLQLVKSGIIGGLTVYGTIGHELPYFGIPVVSCGDNPHVSFSFCKTAKNIDEYKNYLLDMSKTNLTKINKDEVLSFFYMHNLNYTADELNFNKSVNIIRSMMGSNNLDLKIIKEIKKLDNFINNSQLSILNN
ncbi:hypothetical protein G6700_01760 [Polynucleobacter paneuropaeus]|nr:hypothetical protein G6700_01760 [Polynucleobacter paneuropaeus]